MKIAKSIAVTYKGKLYTLEQFATVVRTLSKEELSQLIRIPKYTSLLARYVRDYPECLSFKS